MLQMLIKLKNGSDVATAVAYKDSPQNSNANKTVKASLFLELWVSVVETGYEHAYKVVVDRSGLEAEGPAGSVLLTKLHTNCVQNRKFLRNLDTML